MTPCGIQFLVRESAQWDSRFHAEVAKTPDGIMVTDLESTNGTWYGNARVRQIIIEPGVKFRTGAHRITVQLRSEKYYAVPTAEEALGELVGRSRG